MISLRRTPWRMGLAIVALWGIHACEEVSVTAVEVATVRMSPSSQVELFPGDTLRLAATPSDASGTPLPGRTLSWSSENPSVALVDASGLVRAASPGETRIRARSDGVEGTIAVTVQPLPEIVLSESQVLFEGTAGQGPTPARTVQITSGGTTPLSGLSVQVEPPSEGGVAWLQATLDGSQTPTTLSLRASAAALSAGTYQTTVLVGSATTGTSPQTLTVEFSVGAPAAAIRLSPEALGFAWEAGQAAPPPQSVAITNAGDAQATGLETSLRYGPGEPTGWLSAQLDATSAPTTLTLSVIPGGLAPGVYEAFVQVSSPVASDSPQEVRVRLTAGDPPPEIELSPSSVGWTVTESQGIPAQWLIDVTNRGGGSLTGLDASVSYAAGEPSGWLNVNRTSSVAPAVLELGLATTELIPGNYTATIAVASDDAINSPQTASVQLEVLPRVAPERSEVTADPEVINADGESTSLVTVLLRDPRGDPYPFGGSDVELATTGGTLGEVVDETDGTYTAVLTAPAETGEGEISGTVDGTALGGTAVVTFVADSEPVSASLSTATADPQTGVEADGTAASRVTVELRDANRNPVGGLVDGDFSIELTGDAARSSVTETTTAGTYTFDVTNTTAETVTVTVTADGVTLDDQPTIEFTLDSAPVSASLSTASASPDTAVVADGTSAFTVSMRIRDPDGSFVTGLQDEDFSIALTGSAQAGAVTSRPPPGAHEFEVTNTVAEVVTVTITVLGVTLDDQPTLEFRAGPVSAEVSSVWASPSTGVTADGSDASVVTIEVRDANGNAIGGFVDDDFSIDVSGDGEDGSVSATNGVGTFTFDVTNETAETVTVTVELEVDDDDEVTFNDRPTIEFVAGTS